MTSERNQPHAVAGVFQYRHEAEFAAGFLEDAGIPFRLQVDDAGGADAGMSLANPARLWVRSEHLAKALELIGTPEPGPPGLQPVSDEDEPPPTGLFVRAPVGTDRALADVGNASLGVQHRGRDRLCTTERTVAGMLSVVCIGVGMGVGPTLSPTGGSAAWTTLVFALGAAFGLSALLGRSWGPIRSLLRMLSGVHP